MLIVTKIVTLNEFNELRQNRKWNKLVLQFNKNRNTHDIKVDCYLGLGKSDHNGLVKNLQFSLLEHSQNDELPIEIRSKFGGLYTKSLNNGYLRQSDFKELLSIERNYKISLNIPNSIKNVIKELL